MPFFVKKNMTSNLNECDRLPESLLEALPDPLLSIELKSLLTPFDWRALACTSKRLRSIFGAKPEPQGFDPILRSTSLGVQFDIVKIMRHRAVIDTQRVVGGAAHAGHWDLIVYMLRNFDSLRNPRHVEFVFAMSCGRGHKRNAERLIAEFGASDFENALSTACHEGQWKMAEWLITKHGAKDFQRAITAACQGNQREVLLKLLQKNSGALKLGHISATCHKGHYALTSELITMFKLTHVHLEAIGFHVGGLDNQVALEWLITKYKLTNIDDLFRHCCFKHAWVTARWLFTEHMGSDYVSAAALLGRPSLATAPVTVDDFILRVEHEFQWSYKLK